MSTKTKGKNKPTREVLVDDNEVPGPSGSNPGVRQGLPTSNQSELDLLKTQLSAQTAMLKSLMAKVNGAEDEDEMDTGDDESKDEHSDDNDMDSMSDLVRKESEPVPKVGPSHSIDDFLQEEDETEDGPPIDESVANKIDKYTSDDISKEKLEKFKSRTLVPKNCTQFFSAPKMNPDIWSVLPTSAKSADVKAQSNQTMVVKAQSCFALIANEVVAVSDSLDKEVCEKILRWTMEGSAFLAYTQRELNSKRKHAVKPFLDGQYAGLCTMKTNRGSKDLFGDNLLERMKDSKSLASLARQVGGSRGNPHRRGSSRGNFRGRGRTNGRGGTHPRGRPKKRFQQYYQDQASPQQPPKP